jgi:hypothetical protein
MRFFGRRFLFVHRDENGDEAGNPNYTTTTSRRRRRRGLYRSRREGNRLFDSFFLALLNPL